MSANDTQIGGDHYKTKAVQPWDFIVSNGLGYLEGCVVKYVSRHSLKGGIEDLQKAQHYLSKLIELQEPQEPAKIVEVKPLEVELVAVKPIVKTPASIVGVRRRGRPPGVKNKRRGAK